MEKDVAIQNVEDFYKDFAERIRFFRILKNVSARRMSIDMGHSQAYVSNMEKGKTVPSIKEFYNICDYLGVDYRFFFGVTVENMKEIFFSINRRQVMMEIYRINEDD